MSKKLVTRRVVASAARSVRSETLEPRRLLAAIGFDVETIEWKGQEYQAAAGEVIVEYTGDASPFRFDVAPRVAHQVERAQQVRDFDRALDQHFEEAAIDRHLGTSGTFLVTSDTATTAQLLAATRQIPGVRFAEPNFVHTLDTLASETKSTSGASLASTPNDPDFSDLWGLSQPNDADIDAPEAWDISTGSGVIVAVIDTGIDYNHPDLADNVWVNAGEIPGDGIDNDNNGFVDDIHGWDPRNGDGDPMDGHSHGTHVAGTIAAVGNNGTGVVGVAYDAQVMGIKIFDDSGSTTDAAIIEGINYVTEMRLRGENIVVSNNSWGGGPFGQAERAAIEAHNNAGILFAAAAGNDYGNNNDSNPHYPSNYNLPGIVSVASSNSSDGASSFTNYGPTTVDLAAPGSDILSTVPGGGYGYKGGTSMATPHVSGVIALINSVAPGISTADAKAALLDSVDLVSAFGSGGSDPVLTGGRLNAYQAILPLGNPGLYGEVFDDVNGDGIRQGGEAGLADRVVYLDLNDDGAAGIAEPSAITDATGRYGFESLAGGDYTLRLLDEVGRRQTLPAPSSEALTVAPGLDVTYVADSYNAGNNFATSTSTLVTGIVFNDNNGNGLFDGDDTARTGEQLFLDADGDEKPGEGRANVTDNTVRAIDDYETTVGQLDVPLDGVVSEMSVRVTLSHTWTGDLDITLVAPDGSAVMLFDRHGGSGNDLVNTVFSDDASQGISSGDAPFSGTFRPVQPLSTLEGVGSLGTWSLEVHDNAGLDQGALQSWTLDIGSGDERLVVSSDGRYSMVIPEGETQRIRQLLPENLEETIGSYDIVGGGGSVMTNMNFGSGESVVVPQVVDAWFDYASSFYGVRVQFDGIVPVDASGMSVAAISDGSTVDTMMLDFIDGDVARFVTTTGLPLPDGNYEFVFDGTGLGITETYTFNDFALSGDINRDRAVNLSDFTTLRNNFGSIGNFASGDLTGDFYVDLADFTLLRNSFGNTVAAPLASLFSDTSVDDDRLL
jgi:subtilisin family serine protease/subtilisin-like proprotein convertase family protein